MTPSYPRANLRNVRTTYSIFGSYRSLFTDLFSYIPYVQFRKAHNALPSLASHIDHIIPMCAQKKMFRINTRWIIAAMQNLFTPWYSAPEKYPCGSMRKETLFPHPKVTVSISVFRSNPSPAGRCFYHLCKEAFFIPAIHKKGIL